MTLASGIIRPVSIFESWLSETPTRRATSHWRKPLSSLASFSLVSRETYLLEALVSLGNKFMVGYGRTGRVTFSVTPRSDGG